MKQISFSDLDYLAKSKITKKERFLAEIERVVPFARLEAVIEPHYPKTGSKGGRPSKPLAVMLRVYMLQNWFGYSDPGMEEAPLRQNSCRLDRTTLGAAKKDEHSPIQTSIQGQGDSLARLMAAGTGHGADAAALYAPV